MKRSLVYAAAFFLLLLYVPIITSSRHISHSNSRKSPIFFFNVSNVCVDFHVCVTFHDNLIGHGHSYHEVANMRRPMEVAGSRLPDCSHACGSCSPCKLVMVSLVCASLAEAESCPMAYKCMCHNKSYPVPQDEFLVNFKFQFRIRCNIYSAHFPCFFSLSYFFFLSLVYLCCSIWQKLFPSNENGFWYYEN